VLVDFRPAMMTDGTGCCALMGSDTAKMALEKENIVLESFS